jgi:hypothetical protein
MAPYTLASICLLGLVATYPKTVTALAALYLLRVLTR